MQLSYVLGLRTKEAVQSCKSVNSWLRELDSGHDSLLVVFGTKGGRPRDTTIINRDAVKHTLIYAKTLWINRMVNLSIAPILNRL